MKKLLMLACVVYMTVACGTEVVDRRSFISSSDSTVKTSEGNSEGTTEVEPDTETQVPTDENQPKNEEQTLPLSTLDWNGVDVIGTKTLGVLSITRGDMQ